MFHRHIIDQTLIHKPLQTGGTASVSIQFYRVAQILYLFYKVLYIRL